MKNKSINNEEKVQKLENLDEGALLVKQKAFLMIFWKFYFDVKNVNSGQKKQGLIVAILFCISIFFVYINIFNQNLSH